ncbi:MAG TPA: MazG nucleotide pyrophosphohydrolase domain-containing protein [Bacillota bacterium]|nr:MazG nucleotide pyrophosphohydrolase domain-containing protein [Bacillota bacterium]
MSSELHLKQDPTLGDLQQYVRELVVERGFKDDVASKFMLLTEEVGEFAKAARKHAGMGYATDVAPQNVADEAADILIVMLALCNMMGVDLEQAFRDKEERNKLRVWKKA